AAPPPAATAPGAPAVPVAPPTSAVISLDNVLATVATGSDFPVAGPVFTRVGSLFQLVSLTSATATVSIVGGSYANGADTLTLQAGRPVTLQNTADGTKYTLVLEPQGTPLPVVAAGAPAIVPGAPAAPTVPPGSVVPAGSGG
ncbi:MAG: hypothetical protein ACYDCH_14540, partial [Gaiellaceae bacterium]